VLFAFVVFGLVSSVLHQEIGWEERRCNDVFCVEWDTKNLKSVFCMYLGVVLASLGAGLGEFTFLSLLAHFDK